MMRDAIERVLARGISSHTWARLCRTIEDADVPELERRLDAWPASLRLAPKPWIEKAAAGAPPPALVLCRRLDAPAHTAIDFVRLFGLPELSRISHLVIDYSSKAVEAIPHASFFPNLVYLVTGGDLEDALPGLASAPAPPKLVGVDASSAYLKTRGLEQMLGLPFFGAIRELALGWNELPDSAMKVLARTRGLRRLSLRDNDVRAKGMQALCESDALTDIEWLDLRGCNLKDAGVDALARTRLDRLRHLDLEYTKIKDAPVKGLGAFSSLASLSLGSNAIGDASIPVLASMRALERLDLDGTRVKNLTALEPLAPTLKELDLGSSPVRGDTLAAFLAKATSLRRLRFYRTAGKIRPALTIAKMTTLEHLYIGSKLTPEEVEALLGSANPLVSLEIETDGEPSDALLARFPRPEPPSTELEGFLPRYGERGDSIFNGDW